MIWVFKNIFQVFETILHHMLTWSIVSCKWTDKKSSLLSNLFISMSHESRSDSNEIIFNHLISRFLMVNQLIQSFQSISAFWSFKVLLKKNLLEFHDGSIKYCNCDLVWLDVTWVFTLQVWMSFLKRLLNDMVFVWLHFVS